MYKPILFLLATASISAVQITTTGGQRAVRGASYGTTFAAHSHYDHGHYGHGHGPVYHGFGHSHTSHMAGSDEDDATRDIIHSYEHRIAFLEAEILSLSRMNNNEDVLQEQVAQLTAANNQLECDNKRLRDQVNDNERDAQIIEELRAANADLTAENIRMNVALEAFQGKAGENSENQFNAAEFQRVNSQLEARIDALVKQNAVIPELRALIQEMKDRICDLEKQVLVLEAARSEREKDLQAEVDKLTDRVHELEHEVEKMEEVMAENESLRQQLDEANETIAARDATIAQNQADMAAMEAENDDLRAQINKLNDQLCNCENEVERLKRDNCRLNQENDDLRAEVASNEARIEELRSANEAANLQVNDLQNQLSAANDELSRANAAIADWEAQGADMQAQIDQLNATVAERDASIADLEQQVADLQAQVDQLNMTVAAVQRQAVADVAAAKKQARSKYSAIIRNLEGQNHILQHRISDYEDRLGLNRNKPASVNAQITVSGQSGVQTRQRDERFTLYGGNYMQRTNGTGSVGGVMVGSA